MLLLSGSVTNQPTLDIDFSSVLSGLRKVRVYIYDVRVETDGACVDMMTSSNAGSTFDNSAGQYEWAFMETYNDTTILYKASTANHGNLDFQYRVSTRLGNDTGENGAFEITLHNPGGSAYHKLIEHVGAHHWTDGKIVSYKGSGIRKTTTPINAIRFQPSDNGNSGVPKGNITAEWAVYGE